MRLARHAPIVLALLVSCAGPGDESRREADREIVAFDFVDRFDPRHAGREVHEIDFGAPATRALLRDGWSVDERSGRDTFVWAQGESSSLDLFVLRPRPIPIAFRCMPPPFQGLPEQRVAIEVNGEPVAEIALEPRWRDYRVEVPAEAWQSGRNRVRFRYAFTRSAAESGGDPADTRRVSAAWDWLRLEDHWIGAEPRVEAGRLLLPLASQVDYYLKVPPQSDLIVAPPESSAAEGAPEPHRVELTIEPADGSPKRVHRLDGSGVRLDLAELAGRFARISFRAVPEPRWLARVLERLGWEGPASRTMVDLARPVLRAATAPQPAALPADDPPAGPRRRPNVLVYLIDTLRADHLGCYGYERPVSPNIDGFAGDAVRFERSWAQSSWTRASVASLLTGLHPQTHRVTGRRHSLPGEADTLPERLRDLGYETAGFVTNVNVASEFGFAQGFDRYLPLPETRSREIHRMSDALNDVVFAWLEARPRDTAPFFLYVHATDPHAPYTPREPWLSRFAPGVDPRLGDMDSVKRLSLRVADASEAERQALVALYDAEIAFNDSSFGALLTRLRELDLYDPTLIVLASDHGEEFLEHGGWQHGVTLYEEQLRIPFLVRFPDGTSAGRSVDSLAQLVDVVPTVLDYLGEAIPAAVEGRSLLRALEEDAEEPPGIAHLDLDDWRMEAVLDGGRKLIRSLPARLHTRVELYDLDADPAEQRDLSTRGSFRLGPLHATLDGLSTAPTWTAREVEVMPDVEDRLRALGYLQ